MWKRFIVFHVDGSLVETELGQITTNLGILAESTYGNFAVSITLIAKAFLAPDKIKIQALGYMDTLI